MSPPYGWDTNGVILTMADWPGRTDTNEKLMATQSSMVFFTMHLDYPKLFEQLNGGVNVVRQKKEDGEYVLMGEYVEDPIMGNTVYLYPGAASLSNSKDKQNNI